MSLFAPSTIKDYPPEWGVLDQLGPSLYAATGWKHNLPFARRFGARYRFAKAFQEVKLAGYKAPTQDGYSALMKLALTYSAFENFLQLVGCPIKAAQTILRPYPVDQWVATLRRIDPKCVMFRFIEPRLRPNHERCQVQQFLAGKSCDVAALAAAVRHIFLHGELTPNAGAGEGDPERVCRICRVLCRIMIGVMDKEIAASLGPLRRKHDVNIDDFFADVR